MLLSKKEILSHWPLLVERKIKMTLLLLPIITDRAVAIWTEDREKAEALKRTKNYHPVAWTRKVNDLRKYKNPILVLVIGFLLYGILDYCFASINWMEFSSSVAITWYPALFGCTPSLE
jgi:hypothetical protein